MTRAVGLALIVVAFATSACDRYKHVLTNVERVDEPEDALRVYHDKARGVTCYSDGNGLSCVADIQLRRP
jgi:hypothetical protein